MQSSDILNRAIVNSKSIYERQFKLTKNQFSEENVHDLRVCIRRLLALLSFCNTVWKNKDWKETKTELKSQVKIMSPLRDTQVQIIRTQSWVYSYQELYNYYHYLIEREKLLVSELKTDISKLVNFKVLELIDNIKIEIPNKISETDFLKIAQLRYSALIKRFNASNEDDLSTIHKTRLVYKKFRYTMEIINPIINLSQEDFKLLKSLQTLMGNIQDNNVFLNQLQNYNTKTGSINTQNFEKIESEILNERKEIINRYFSEFSTIEYFHKLIA